MVARGPELFSLEEEPGGGLPAPLSEVAGRQEKVVRHVMEDLGSVCPFVHILDLPVPQMVGDVTDALRILDFPVAEQVIEVPKISCSPCPSRSRVPEPQTAEQLVEVPTVLFPTRIAEQIVDTPVPRGRGQGFLPEQSSTAISSGKRISERTVEQIVDIPSSGGSLAHGSSSSAGPADEDFTGGFSHFSPMEKVRSAGQVVSAKLGGHVSSSTLSAHQMARAGEPADSDGSIEWVKLHVGETDKTYYWNRRSGATSWHAPPGVKVVWMGGKSDRGMVWYFNQVTGCTAHALPPQPAWVTGYGVRGLASPHPFLGATPLACSKSGPGECGLLPGAFRRR